MKCFAEAELLIKVVLIIIDYLHNDVHCLIYHANSNNNNYDTQWFVASLIGKRKKPL